MEFSVTILGSNAALPAFGRHPSSQLITWGHEMFLVDCGEGTQMRLSDFKIRRSRISRIFISHLHGDHVFGLPGLITSFVLNNRKDPLTIYGPAPLQSMLQCILQAAQAKVTFPLTIVELAVEHRVFLEAGGMKVESFPLDHRIDTLGYKFTMQHSMLKVDKEAKESLGISREGIIRLIAGESWQNEAGQTILPEMVCRHVESRHSYAYCSDTRFNTAILPVISGVDLLYHESTYADDMEAEALGRYHSTARQAAQIAALAGVGKLLLGHYSSRYKDLNLLLDQARSVFFNSFLSVEGEVYAIENQSDGRQDAVLPENIY